MTDYLKKLSIYATDSESISEIDELKDNKNLSEIQVLKIVQSENLVSMQVK